MNKRQIADSTLFLAQNESELFGIVDEKDTVIVPFDYNVGQMLPFGGKVIVFLHKHSQKENLLVFGPEKIVSFKGNFTKIHECCAICAPFLLAYEGDHLGVLRVEGNQVITLIPPVYDFIKAYAWPEFFPSNPNRYMPAKIFEAYTATTLKKEADIFDVYGAKLFQKAKIIEIADGLCALQNATTNDIIIYSFRRNKVVLKELGCSFLCVTANGGLSLLCGSNSYYLVNPDGEPFPQMILNKNSAG